MNELIYNFKENGLHYESNEFLVGKEIVTFTIATVQIECDYSCGEVLSLNGYLPLINARREKIVAPKHVITDNFSIDMRSIKYLRGVAYNYFDYFPNGKSYFVKDVVSVNGFTTEVFSNICYDEGGQKILLGILEGNEKSIQINRNIIFGFDEKESLKFICIILDEVIND